MDSKHIDIILEIVGRFSHGASVEEILLGLSPQPSRRTLQYQLAKLIEKDLLVATGKTRNRRYKVKTFESSYVQLTPSSLTIQQTVNLPLSARISCSYNRNFLDDYKPNKTYYLADSIRAWLFEKGRTDGNLPAGTYARKIYQRLLIDLAWNSSRLEGNTYSLLETERLFKLGKAASGKERIETQMILNHKAAIEFLIESAEAAYWDRFTICNIHALLASQLIHEDACGILRQISVGIGKSVYTPSAIPQVICECFQEIVDKAKAIEDPFEQSFFLMVHLPYLQPFENINKRTSRLATNLPLIKANLCPLSFVDVPQKLYVEALLGVYELNRPELLAEVYVWAYERSALRYSAVQRQIGPPDAFLMQTQFDRKAIINSVIKECLDKEKAIAFIRHEAQKIAQENRAKFIESIERDLMSVYEGNIARFDIRPKEFHQWQKYWH